MEEKYHDVFAHIGLKMMFYRKQRGLTQAQLAELTSFSRNHIQQIETARAVPSVAALLDIAKALGISIVDLFA